MSWAGPEDIYLSTSLAGYLDKKLLILLRDGRKLMGTLRSFDQFANVVLEGACERVIVAIENPQDIIVQSARPYGQRAVLKFAQYTGAHAIAERHTPETFTNQFQTSFSEPRLLILTDPESL